MRAAGSFHSDYIRRYILKLDDLPANVRGDDLREALKYWHWTCAYCGRSLAQLSMFEDVRLHFDHYIAKADLRPDNPGTVATNLLPTCHRCNHSKKDRDPVEWINWKFDPRKAKRIIARIEAYFASVKV
ncbi:MAG: HNH endonuclease [Aggregatilineales bacterium]